VCPLPSLHVQRKRLPPLRPPSSCLTLLLLLRCGPASSSDRSRVGNSAVSQWRWAVEVGDDGGCLVFVDESLTCYVVVTVVCWLVPGSTSRAPRLLTVSPARVWSVGRRSRRHRLHSAAGQRASTRRCAGDSPVLWRRRCCGHSHRRRSASPHSTAACTQVESRRMPHPRPPRRMGRIRP
jgi:hypothetical protein